MKNYPKFCSKIRNSAGGFSAVELIIASSILVILLGISLGLFKNITRSQWRAETTLNLAYYCRNAVQLIAKDLKSASRTELGSTWINGSFEIPYINLYPRSYPWGWALSDNSVGTHTAYLYGGSTDYVRVGNCSVGFIRTTPTVVAIESINSTISQSQVLQPYTTYFATCWMRNSNNGVTNAKLKFMASGAIELMAFETSSNQWTECIGSYYTGVTSISGYNIRFNNEPIGPPPLAFASASYLDGVSIAPVKSVLASKTETVNQSEFTFMVCESINNVNMPVFYRYIIQNNTLVRQQCKGEDTFSWVDKSDFPKISFIEELIFEFTQWQTLGKNSPLRVKLTVHKQTPDKADVRYSWETLVVPDIP